MKKKYSEVMCKSNNSINYSRNIDEEIKNTIKRADKIEKEMIDIENKIRLLL